MGNRGKIGDLVVVVPGVFGSSLLCDGSALWGDDSPTFLEWSRRHSSDLALLSVGADDPALDDLGDGVVAGDLLENLLVVGRFAKVGGYAPLVRFLSQDVGLRTGENLAIFPYDWRRDVRVAARKLAAKIDGWLDAWRLRPGHAQARVALVCHGLGGLVGEQYIEVEGGWPKVSKIVTIGCPFLGSIRALDLLYFGVDFQSYGLPHHDLTPVARTLTSVYEMLPRYPSIRMFDGGLLSPFDLRIPSFEHHKMERARQLHRDLVERHERNRVLAGYAVARTAIVGVAQPTAELARLLPNGTLAIDGDGLPTLADGDGVVPRFSAEAPGAGFAGRWYYVPQSQGMLVRDPTVHALLRDILVGPKPVDAAVETPLARFTLRRSAGDPLRIEVDGLSVTTARPFYRTGERVEIRVEARSASGRFFDVRAARLRATLEPVAARGRATVLRLVPDREHPGRAHAHARPTAPGLYRVTVSSRNPHLTRFPSSEFFEVEAKSPR